MAGVSHPTHATSPALLAAMRHGQTGVVVNIDEPRLGARLAARGLVPGAMFQVLRGGDPLLVKIDESRWAISGAEAALIEVDILPATRKRLSTFFRKIFT